MLENVDQMNEEPVKRGPGRPRKIFTEQQVSASEKPLDVGNTSSPEPTFDTPAAPTGIKVFIYPSFGGEDKGDGGIRHVVEAQLKWLPKFGIEIAQNPEEADVIAYHATVPQAFINNYPQKAFVAMVHGLYWSEYEWGNWAIQANKEVMEGIRVSDAVIAPTEWVANNIRRHTSRRVYVIPHGLDIEEWTVPEQPGNYVLWNKTRPDPVCDPEPVNQVAARLPYNKFMTTFGNAASNVEVTGKKPFLEAKENIRNAGVYLCTSRETFGIGTLEAMACGVPVVGFNWGGQAEFLKHQENAWLAAPGDIDGLTEGINWAFNNRQRLSSASRQIAEQFPWENACRMYAQIFSEALRDKHISSSGKIRPRTSIIVTNYNLDEYLNDCLDSVERQTDSNWECIIVDDASPNPRGKDIVRGYASRDPRFKLVANEKNVYLAEARNVGIRAAQGRYILPLDADDMLAPNAVKLLADALSNNRSIHVAYGNVMFVNDDGRTPTDYSDMYKGTSIQVSPGHSTWPFPFRYEQQIQKMNLLPYCSMFRKEAWKQVGGYRRRQRTAEDADLWVRMSSYGFRPEQVTKEDTLVYRNREGSMSRKQGDTDWTSWFTWSKLPKITPAGAATQEQLPVPSLDPVIISVIIPVGPGHEGLVQDAVDSVGAQTFQNWECTVVNDTGKELPELPAWARIVDWKLAELPSGTAAARNRGIAISRGKLFLPLDADDYLMPDALEHMLAAYRIEGDIIYSDFWQDNKEELTVHHCDDYDPTLLTGKTRVVNGETRMGMIHSVTALTPKKAWEEVGGYDEKVYGWEDWDFQLSVADKGYCSRRVAAPLFMYRKHTGYRREENHAAFDKSKEAILQKWGDLWKGVRQLMACGSCAAKRASYLPAPTFNQTPKTVNTFQNQDAVLVKCRNGKAGSMPFRGPSKTTYWFSDGDSKYVLTQDLEVFKRFGSDFEIVEPSVEVGSDPSAPALVAEGAPAN